MHMANALKVPTVALFGPTDPEVTAPFQEPSVYIKKDVPCWPCAYRECPFDHRCMLDISSEEVFKACLGDYDHIGFKMTQLDDHFLELFFMGKHVAYFSAQGATVAGIRQACQEYLNRYEFERR